MVARGIPPADPLEQVLAALAAVATAFFSAWRRLLEGALRLMRALGRTAVAIAQRWVAHWARIRDYLTDPADARHGPATRSAAAAFGVRAFAFGMLASGALTVAGGGPTRAAIAAIAVEVMWAAGRFAVCAAILPTSAVPRDRLLTAYLAGLVPYALGLNAALRLVALGASAVITTRGLRAEDGRAPGVRTAIVWAFGGQVAVVTFGFVARAVLALLAGA